MGGQEVEVILQKKCVPEVCVPLKDVPLDVRREEAKKPLYLTRYE